MSRLTTVINAVGTEVVKTIPFGTDYRHINALLFCLQLRDKIQQEIATQEFSEVIKLQVAINTVNALIADADPTDEQFDTLAQQSTKLQTQLITHNDKLARLSALQKSLDEIEK